jgi:hypothetical protein
MYLLSILQTFLSVKLEQINILVNSTQEYLNHVMGGVLGILEPLGRTKFSANKIFPTSAKKKKKRTLGENVGMKERTWCHYGFGQLILCHMES